MFGSRFFVQPIIKKCTVSELQIWKHIYDLSTLRIQRVLGFCSGLLSSVKWIHIILVWISSEMQASKICFVYEVRISAEQWPFEYSTSPVGINASEECVRFHKMHHKALLV